MGLHIQIESRDNRTEYNVHHFVPDTVREYKSDTGPAYDYITLSQGRYDDPSTLRLFFGRDELIALFDQLAPFVAAMRPPAPAPIVAPSPSDAPEVALL